MRLICWSWDMGEIWVCNWPHGDSIRLQQGHGTLYRHRHFLGEKVLNILESLPKASNQEITIISVLNPNPEKLNAYTTIYPKLQRDWPVSICV